MGEVGAVFEAFVFEPEDVEVELESPAVAPHPLRVTLKQVLVTEALEALGFFSLSALTSQGNDEGRSE